MAKDNLQPETLGGASYPRTPNSDVNPINLTNPDDMLGGTLRSTQNVGSGGTQIDSANNRIALGSSILLDGNNQVITITNSTGAKVGLGKIPGSTGFGFFAVDSSGNLLMKIVDSTLYAYDITNNKNIIQILKLPDSTYGMAIAKPGFNVADGIS